MQYPPLTITFLGTGTSTGIPMIGCRCAVCASSHQKDKRLRSSVWVQSPQTSVVIDTTPDFRYQMLRADVQKLDAVLFTHPHKDHIAGLDDVRAFNFFQHRVMPLYANALTIEALHREFGYAFAAKRYAGVPHLELHKIEEDRFCVNELFINPIPVWHHKMPVLGFRFGKFAYITDANRIDEAAMMQLQELDVLVINALRQEAHLSHFTLSEAMGIAEKLRVNKTYFTHISHQMGLHHEVEKNLPQDMHLAYDGLVVQVP